jgi:hypothetical protein
MYLQLFALIFRGFCFFNILNFGFSGFGEFFRNRSINFHDLISFLKVKFGQERHFLLCFCFTSVNYNVDFLFMVILRNVVQRCVQFIDPSFRLIFESDYVLDRFLFVGFVNLGKVFMWKVNIIRKGFGFFGLALLELLSCSESLISARMDLLATTCFSFGDSTEEMSLKRFLRKVLFAFFFEED